MSVALIDTPHEAFTGNLEREVASGDRCEPYRVGGGSI